MAARRISIFGLGYVGMVSAACFAEAGHDVVGVDAQAAKADHVARGESPIAERALPELVREAVARGQLRATVDAADAVRSTDVSIVCVGTPSRRDGDIDLGYVGAVCSQIGDALRGKSGYHVVVIRSTVVPGAVRGVVIPTLEAASRRSAGRDFGVVMHPEFLREGSAVADFREPSRIVIGELDQRSGDAVAALYDGFATDVTRTSIEIAELVKYADNAWHALKIAFANEVGAIARAAGVEPRPLMRLFCEDRRLNISPVYLRPGPPFGGSCLPKDLRAVTAWCERHGVAVPVLSAVLPSNEGQLRAVLDHIRASGLRRIGFLGVAFKPGTDDVRESPFVAMIQALSAEGYHVRLHDPHVVLNRMIGANQHFLLAQLPDFVRHVCQDVGELVDDCDVLVVCHDTAEYRRALERRRADQRVIDVAGVLDDPGVAPDQRA